MYSPRKVSYTNYGCACNANELTTLGSVSVADGKAVWKGLWGPVCVRLKKAILNCTGLSALYTVIVSRHDNKGQSSY